MNPALASKWNADFDRYLTRYDMFGVKIGLTYGVSPFYSATVGKITTVFLYIYMIYYGLNTVLPVFTNETKSLTTELRRGADSANRFNPAAEAAEADGFSLAFGFLNEMPDNYGSFEFSLVTRTGGLGGPKVAKTIGISNDKCGDKPAEYATILDAVPEAKNMRCSNVWRNELYGSHLGSTGQAYVQFEFKPCLKPNADCASPD